MSELRYSRVRDVKQPNRGTKVSAGIDLFLPTFDKKFLKDFVEKNPCISSLRKDSYSYLISPNEKNPAIYLAPNERLMIPSGIKMDVHENTPIIAFNKSGIGVKKGIDILACVIDEDYTGEIHISIVNTSNFIVKIEEGEKIIQGLEVKVDYSNLTEVSEKDLFKDFKSERGEGGFGSTGTK